MNTFSDLSLFDHTQTNSSDTRTFINLILWFDDCDGYRVIFCRHEILYRVGLDDSVHLALVAAAIPGLSALFASLRLSKDHWPRWLRVERFITLNLGCLGKLGLA